MPQTETETKTETAAALVPLSQNKTNYLSRSAFPAEGSTLHVKGLLLLAEHYHQKFGISIFIENHLEIPVDNFFQKSEEILRVEERAFNEILSIKKTLAPGRYVGYIYTNQCKEEEYNHFEAIVISAEMVIKPIEWAICDRTLNPESYLHYSITAVTHPSYLSGNGYPQSGRKECGTLCLSYLKNLLKEDAHQIKEYSLLVPFYKYKKDSESHKHFFLPSPQVLQYSQSDKYNKFMQSLLSKGTIQARLIETRVQALKLNQPDVAGKAEALLASLPAFQDRWLQAYEKMSAKRSLFQKQHNQYLIYTSLRYHRWFIARKQQRKNPGLEILKGLNSLTKESKDSKDSIEGFLAEKVPLIPFESVTEISYFLGKVGEPHYLKVLDHLCYCFNTWWDLDNRIDIFLTELQFSKLKAYLSQFENFKRLIGPKLDILALDTWAEKLNISTEIILRWLPDLFDTSQMQSQVLSFIEKGHIDNLFKELFFGDNPSRLTFIRKYISDSQIIAALPSFFINRRLSQFATLFENETLYLRFLLQHLPLPETILSIDSEEERYFSICCFLRSFPKEEQSQLLFQCIGDTVLTAFTKPTFLFSLLKGFASGDMPRIQSWLQQHPLDIQSMLPKKLGKKDAWGAADLIESYMDLFDKTEYSNILFQKIGDNILCELLVDQYKISKILIKYASAEDALQFITRHRLNVLKSMLDYYALGYLAKILQHTKTDALAFLCPENEDFFLGQYQSLFKDILSDETGKAESALQELLQMLGMDQRLLFIERVFEPSMVEAVCRLPVIARLISKSESKSSPVSRAIAACNAAETPSEALTQTETSAEPAPIDMALIPEPLLSQQPLEEKPQPQPQPEPKPKPQPQQSPAPKPKPKSSAHLCLRILSGISLTLGAAALILAFVVLNIATLGGIIAASCGAAAILVGGLGLFATRNKKRDRALDEGQTLTNPHEFVKNIA